MKQKTFLLVILLLFSISLTSAFPIVVRPLSSGNIMPSQVIDYKFDFTTDNLCSNVLSSHSVNITTDKYGVGYTNLDISSLSSTPSYLCEFRGGPVRTVHSIPDMIFRDILANNVTADYFIGDGSYLTGISSGSGNSSYNATYDATSKDVTANRSSWFSTYNTTYDATSKDVTANRSSWFSTYNETYDEYAYNQSTDISGLVPYSGATSDININNKTIRGSTAVFNGTNSLYSQGISWFGNSVQNIVISLLDLGAYGTYGMIGGNSDGAFGNIFAVADSLILYDYSDNGQTTIAFSSNDVSNIAGIKYSNDTSTFELIDSLGADDPKNLKFTGKLIINKDNPNALINIGPEDRRFPAPIMVISGDWRVNEGLNSTDVVGLELATNETSAGISYEQNKLNFFVNKTDSNIVNASMIVQQNDDVYIRENLNVTSNLYVSGCIVYNMSGTAQTLGTCI